MNGGTCECSQSFGAVPGISAWVRSLYFLSVILVVSLTAVKLPAADIASAFEAANKLYEQGRYSDAVNGYNQLLASGNVSEALYFNLGNAQFKLGQLGRAIASYREARQLAPRDGELRANLQFARTRARGGSTYHNDRLRVWLGNVSLNEWTLLTAVAFWALFILLALGQWKAELKSKLRSYIVTAAGAAVLFGLCLCLALKLDYLTPSAIVVTGEADVRNGPLDESPGIYKVRDGAELEVVDRKDGWLQVLDPAQRIGWVRQDQVLIFDSGAIRATPLTASER
jgi:tetratricopeptide (TPR) repeat protein